MACRFDTWVVHLREHFGVDVIFDDDHWKKEEIILDIDHSLVDFSSQHIQVWMGERYGALCKTLTPRFKIIQHRRYSPFAIHTIWHIARWNDRTGKYDVCDGGMEYDVLRAATLCEWEFRGHPWKEEYRKWFEGDLSIG